MRTITYQELKKKDVVNIDTGKNLGKITDLVLRESDLQVLKLVVPGKKNGFLNCESFEISSCDVKKIGDDAILVSFIKPKKPPCDLPCDLPRQEGFENNGVEFYDDTV
jgi:YlmC/YmxH family sporulation protein